MVTMVTDPYLVCPAASFFSSSQSMPAWAVLSSFAADSADVGVQREHHGKAEQKDNQSRYMFNTNLSQFS